MLKMLYMTYPQVMHSENPINVVSIVTRGICDRESSRYRFEGRRPVCCTPRRTCRPTTTHTCHPLHISKCCDQTINICVNYISISLKYKLDTGISATGIQTTSSYGDSRSSMVNFSGMASSFDKSRALVGTPGSNANRSSEPLPGETDHLTFVLPEDPPKEKKKKKKKGKGKGKGKGKKSGKKKKK